MREKKRIYLAVVFVCFSLLAGCDRSAEERDRALEEAEEARSELAKTRTSLEEARDEIDKLSVNYTITSEELADAHSERDKLKESLAVIAEELKSTKSKLAEALKTKDDLEYQITELTRQQNAAIVLEDEGQSMIDTLTGQLEERDSTIRELEQWNTELQATVQELQNYIEEIGGQVEEEFQEKSVEQFEGEVYDQNDI